MGWKELKQRIANGNADATDKCAYYSPYIAGFVLAGTVCAKILVEAYKMATGTGGDMNGTLDTLVDNWELGTLAVGSLVGLGSGVGISLNEKGKEKARQSTIARDQAAAEVVAQRDRDTAASTAKTNRVAKGQTALEQELAGSIGYGKDPALNTEIKGYNKQHSTPVPSSVDGLVDGLTVTIKKGDQKSIDDAKAKVVDKANFVTGYVQDVFLKAIDDIAEEWKYNMDGTTTATIGYKLRETALEAPLGIDIYNARVTVDPVKNELKADGGSRKVMKETMTAVIDNGYGKQEKFYRINGDYITDDHNVARGYDTGRWAPAKDALNESEAYKMERKQVEEYNGKARATYYTPAPANPGRVILNVGGVAPAGTGPAGPGTPTGPIVPPPTTTTTPASGTPAAPGTAIPPRGP
jgi:hypothetical protein